MVYCRCDMFSVYGALYGSFNGLLTEGLCMTSNVFFCWSGDIESDLLLLDMGNSIKGFF